jgi:hypothetical protein
MTSTFSDLPSQLVVPIQERLESGIEDLIRSLPDAETLSAEQRRGIIARYSAVLEGNFIYWMTAALLAVKSEEAREIIIENLTEEVRDSHPDMLRRFTLAAHAHPTEADAMTVYRDLTRVRLFMGRLSGVQILITMGLFEGWIQRFMAYLGDLAERQGSTELEYTVVHGVCDITHTAELFRALSIEMSMDPPDADSDLFEGVDLLQSLITKIVEGPAEA